MTSLKIKLLMILLYLAEVSNKYRFDSMLSRYIEILISSNNINLKIDLRHRIILKLKNHTLANHHLHNAFNRRDELVWIEITHSPKFHHLKSHSTN